MSRSLSRLFASALRRSGLVVTTTSHPGVPYFDHPPVNAFHSALLRSFPRLDGLGFIQIGANDGRRADPLAPFIGRYGWHGLLYEPLAANFAALETFHGSNPRLTLRRAAVDLSASRRAIYDLAPEFTARLPDWTRGLASFSRERVAQAAAELALPERAIVSEEVETVTWDRVWNEFGEQRCDLLVLDTEGYDLTLLRAADLARHRPRLILFEHACNTLDERLEFYRLLLELGYDIATFEGDTVATIRESE